LTSPPQPCPTEAERHLALLTVAEGRLQQAATFTWTVPALALAAQAFLLTIALDPDASDRTRAAAAFAGFVTVIASLQFLAKHRFNFDWWEAVIERERAALGWESLQRHKMLDPIEQYPLDTLLRKREWFQAEHELNRNRVSHWLHRARGWFAVSLKATMVWSIALVFFAGLDAVLVVLALLGCL
jgi:hypothetical protein